MTPVTWQVFFDPSKKSARLVQQWMTENAPFFQTPEGAAYLQKINHIKGQYIANEKWFATYGQKAGRGNDYNKRKNELVNMFKTTRANIQTAPTNPAGQPPVGNAPTGAPTNAPGAPPPGLTTAPPVYLPNVSAPQYMFPSADAVKDMTYDPGIGGFLRPNQWQGGIPSNPYGDNRPPSGPAQPAQQPSYGMPRAPMPQGQFQPGLPSPGMPQGSQAPGQFPWQPGY